MQGSDEVGFGPTTRQIYHGTFELYAKMKALSSSASKPKNAEFHPEIETQSAAPIRKRKAKNFPRIWEKRKDKRAGKQGFEP